MSGKENIALLRWNNWIETDRWTFRSDFSSFNRTIKARKVKINATFQVDHFSFKWLCPGFQENKINKILRILNKSLRFSANPAQVSELILLWILSKSHSWFWVHPALDFKRILLWILNEPCSWFWVNPALDSELIQLWILNESFSGLCANPADDTELILLWIFVELCE